MIMKYDIYSLGIMVAVISFLGFSLENLWLSLTKGFIDNRNMNAPFLMGYGLLVVGMYLLLGTPENMALAEMVPVDRSKGEKFFVYFLCAFAVVTVGELILGHLMEKICGIQYWNYNWIPLHITQYTSIPTSIGFAAIIISGIILKKTKLFAGDPAPFVMELPAYHVPAWGNVLRATWERGWSFIKRAGSVILAATVVLWFLQGFGFENGAFGMVEDQDNSVLAAIATKIAWIFAPLGFGNWKATVASVSGLIAKENVVGTFGVLYHFGGEELSENGDEIWSLVAADYTALSAYAFMIFNLLCAPCFAAMGAIKREMNNGKWTAFAIGYMCALAYCSALVVYQLGGLITGEVGFNFFTVVAVVIVAAFLYLMFRPNKYVNDNEVKIDVSKIK